jgi:hypothetical protein
VLEGFELACFIERYWEPDEQLGLPGLKEYVRAQFTETIASELRELALVVAELQGRFNAEFEPPLVAPSERAEEILSELGKALTFLFDDGLDATEDRELKQVKKSFNDRSSHDALAASLDGMAYYAVRHRERLKNLPRFDDAILDEALTVAHRLRSQSGLKLTTRGPHQGRAAIRADRGRVTRALHDRMNIARRTIRYALSDQPELVQRATSQYRRERRQRWREKRRQAKGEAGEADV